MIISRALRDAPELAGLLQNALALEACLRDATDLYVWGLEEEHLTANAVREATLQHGSDPRSTRLMEELLRLRKNTVPASTARS
jgi:hypothetical protein